jgi:hypothetical protein
LRNSIAGQSAPPEHHIVHRSALLTSLNEHHCTSLYITVHHCTSLYTTVHCTSLYVTVLSLYITVHHCTSLYITVDITVHHCAITVHHCTSLYITVHHSTKAVSLLIRLAVVLSMAHVPCRTGWGAGESYWVKRERNVDSLGDTTTTHHHHQYCASLMAHGYDESRVWSYLLPYSHYIYAVAM